jgi:hypothetical protein
MPVFPHCMATKEARLKTAAKLLKVLSSGKSTCRPNQTARFKTTPTTEAVIAERDEEIFLFSLNFSIYGPPRRMKKKEGRKVK